MQNHDNQPTAFSQEQVVSEPTEIERIQNRVQDFKVGLSPASAEATLASMTLLLSKGLIKVEDLDAVITIREEVNKGLIEYQTTVQTASKQMELAQTKLLAEQAEERQRVLNEKDTQIVDERLLRKRTEDNLNHQMNRAAQMEAVLKSHGINIDLDGDGVVGLKEGQVADTLSASEQAEVDSIVHHGYDANGSPTTESPSGKTSGAFKLARMMNPIEQGANGTTAEDMTPSVSETMQAELEPITTEHDESDDLEAAKKVEEYEESKYIPTDSSVPQAETTFDLDKVSRSEIDPEDYSTDIDPETPPQVAGGLIKGEDTESFLDEVDRVQEVADIDKMYEDEDTAEEEGKNIFSGNTEKYTSSAPVITGGNAPNVTRENIADGVFIERENIKSFAEEKDLVEEESFEEVVIPNRKDLEGMTKKEILQSADNLSFEVSKNINKSKMIDSFETQANTLIEELTGGSDFESISEEDVDGDDDRRDGGYF
jgi:hypothetical protein